MNEEIIPRKGNQDIWDWVKELRAAVDPADVTFIANHFPPARENAWDGDLKEDKRWIDGYQLDGLKDPVKRSKKLRQLLAAEKKELKGRYTRHDDLRTP